MTTSEARQSLSLKLKNARKSKRITPQKLAKLISVPTSTIDAIEDGKNTDIPLANLNGLVRKYAKEIHLDMAEIAEEMAVLRPTPQTKTKKDAKTQSSRIFVASKVTYSLVAGIVLAVVLSYALWQAWQLTAAPRLRLESPASDFATSESAVVVKGKTSPESSLLINGSNISLADDGSFEVTIYMQPGRNYLQVRALNALGQEAVEDRIIIYQQ